MIKENMTIKESLRNAKICIPDKDGNLYSWFGGASVTIIDPDTGQNIDYFSVSPWFAARPSIVTVIQYIKERIRRG